MWAVKGRKETVQLQLNHSAVALFSLTLNEVVNVLKQVVGEFGSSILIILALHF